MKLVARPLAMLAFLSLLAPLARAQPADDPPGRTIRVSGEATVTSRPDRVEIDLGVMTRATTSREAAAQNARRQERVLAALRDALGPEAEVETIGYALHPELRGPREQDDAAVTAYRATNVVRVTLDDLDRAGEVIDVAIRAGANEVQRMRYGLKDEAAARARALRRAAVAARAKANALAAALDLEIAGIHSVVETAPPGRPMYDAAIARGGAPSTPIVAGSIETTATVTLTVELASPV